MGQLTMRIRVSDDGLEQGTVREGCIILLVQISNCLPKTKSRRVKIDGCPSPIQRTKEKSDKSGG